MSKQSSNYIRKLNFSNRIHRLADLRVAVWSLLVPMAIYTPKFWLLLSSVSWLSRLTCPDALRETWKDCYDGWDLKTPSSRLHFPNKQKKTCCLFVNRILAPHHVSLFLDRLWDLFRVNMNMCVRLLSFYPIRSSFSLLLIYFQSSSLSQWKLAKVATSNQSHGLFHPTWVSLSSIQALCCYPVVPKPQ